MTDRLRTCAAGAAVVLMLLCLLPACESTRAMLGGASRPDADIQAVRFQDLSLQAVTMLFDVDVKNPYSVPLPLGAVEYQLVSRDKTIVSGRSQEQGTVPAKGSRTISVPATVPFATLRQMLTDIRPGMLLPYRARLSLGADVPGAGTLALPMEHQGELPIPAVPEVELDGVQWQNLSLESATALLKLKVKNTNEFNVALSRMVYALSLGGSSVAQSDLSRAVKLSGGERETLEIPVTFSPRSLGLAAYRMFQGQSLSYALAGTMSLDSPYGPMTVPFSRQGQTAMSR